MEISFSRYSFSLAAILTLVILSEGIVRARNNCAVEGPLFLVLNRRPVEKLPAQ